MTSKYLIKRTNEIINDCTIFGLPNIFKRENVSNKLYWLTFVLIGSLFSIYLTYSSVMDYYNFDIVTKIESIFEQPTQFPTLSFCPEDNFEFNNKKLKEHVISNCLVVTDNSCYTYAENYFEPFTKSMKENKSSQCYRFNSGKNINGSSIIPFLNSTIGGKDDSLFVEIKTSSGLNLWIHDYRSPPYYEYDNNHGSYLQLSSGLKYHIVIDKVTESRLDLPYNDCFKDLTDFNLNRSIIDYIEQKGEKYTLLACLSLCFELSYIEIQPCDCKNFTLGNVWTKCYINNVKEISDCTFNYKMKNFSTDSLFKCSFYCPQICDTISYTDSTYSLSSKSGQVSFRVFYRSLLHTTITQSPKTQLFDLISNIGGIFSLFIGISFVTIFEVFELILEVFFILNKRKITNN